jgi:hypothetical protein
LRAIAFTIAGYDGEPRLDQPRAQASPHPPDTNDADRAVR